MAKWIIPCEWCGKLMEFLTELKKTNWHRCDKCNMKAEKVILNDCYDDILNSLKNGKWVIGKREIAGQYGGVEKDFVIFVFKSSGERIRATRSTENVKDALNNLFSQTWNKLEIEQFGFNSLEEIDPITDIKFYKSKEKQVI